MLTIKEVEMNRGVARTEGPVVELAPVPGSEQYYLTVECLTPAETMTTTKLRVSWSAVRVISMLLDAARTGEARQDQEGELFAIPVEIPVDTEEALRAKDRRIAELEATLRRAGEYLNNIDSYSHILVAQECFKVINEGKEQ